MKLYMVLMLYENSIIHSEAYDSMKESENSVLLLANEWYNKDGIALFGKVELETIDEVKSYYRSDAYFESGDDVHIMIEPLDTNMLVL